MMTYEEEPMKVLRHIDIYNVQTVHRMGFRKINGHWERQKGEPRMIEEGSNRPIEKDLLEIPTAPLLIS